jgi:hypothetical protein
VLQNENFKFKGSYWSKVGILVVNVTPLICYLTAIVEQFLYLDDIKNMVKKLEECDGMVGTRGFLNFLG